jgi:hypothetical protein
MSEEMSQEIIKKYEKLAEENQHKLEEIQENRPSQIFSPKVQNKIARTVRGILGGGMVVGAAASLGACKEPPAVVEEKEEKPTVEVPSEAIQESKEENKLAKEETVEKVNAPKIPELTFNQETGKYFNEVGVEVGVYVEDAIEINDKMEDAVGLVPEEIRKIINENKKRDIFELPWFFNPQENKGIKIVELVSLNGGYKFIGIKYSEPINVYAPSDCVYGYKFKHILQENDPSPFSSQDFSGIYFSTDFEVKNRNGEIVPMDYEIEAVDLKPSVTLSQPYSSGPWRIKHFLEEIKIGRFIGQLLPSSPNYSFLDFRNRADWYENPDHCQASFWMNIFSDRTDVGSDLDRILRLEEEGNKDNRVTVFVWDNDQQRTASK